MKPDPCDRFPRTDWDCRERPDPACKQLRVLHQFSKSGAAYLLATTYTLSGLRQRPGLATVGDSWLADENYTPQLPGGNAVRCPKPWQSASCSEIALASIVSHL